MAQGWTYRPELQRDYDSKSISERIHFHILNLQTWTTKGLWPERRLPSCASAGAAELTDLNYKGIMTLPCPYSFSNSSTELTDLNYKGIMTRLNNWWYLRLIAHGELTDLNYKGIMTLLLYRSLKDDLNARTYRPELQRDYDRKCQTAVSKDVEHAELTDLNYKGIMTPQRGCGKAPHLRRNLQTWTTKGLWPGSTCRVCCMCTRSNLQTWTTKGLWQKSCPCHTSNLSFRTYRPELQRDYDSIQLVLFSHEFLNLNLQTWTTKGLWHRP